MDLFFLIVLGMIAILFFTSIRPQRQARQRHAEMLERLKIGDEVITTGGIYGEIKEVDAERVMLEIDDDVQIAVAKLAIANVVPPEELARLEGLEGTTADEPLTAEERVGEQTRS